MHYTQATAMIEVGRALCLPSPATVQELFSVARDASIIPDISMDPVLTTFLSLDSSAALQHHYTFLQRSMNREQQDAFNLNLTEELGGSRVTYGGVGVVALALSLFFDQVAQQVRAQGSAAGNMSTPRDETKAIFGISSSSRIGRLVHSYLHLVPGVANDEEEMAEITELYDKWLKLELIDHFERMTTKKRMSTVSMQQWLTGAAIHLHIRIHQVRLHSVPSGSASSLRLSYKTSLRRLLQGYTTYLRRNIQVTAAPNPQHYQTTRAAAQPTRSTTTSTTTTTSIACSSQHLFNISQTNVSISSDGFNETSAPNSAADHGRKCKIHGPKTGFDVKGSNKTTAGMSTRETLSNVTVSNSEKEADALGLLVIEPSRNVSHSVRHLSCESPAIQQALVTRIMNAQDLERNRNLFQAPEKVFHSLLRQRGAFEIKTN